MQSGIQLTGTDVRRAFYVIDQTILGLFLVML